MIPTLRGGAYRLLSSPKLEEIFTFIEIKSLCLLCPIYFILCKYLYFILYSKYNFFNRCKL